MEIIILLQDFAADLLEVQQDFSKNPEQIGDLKKRADGFSRRFGADLLAMTLTQTDKIICESSLRKKKYNIQRNDSCTLMTS